MSERAAVVTGGGTGIGEAAAAELLRGGYRVLICSRREEVLQDAVGRLSELGEVVSVAADVSRYEEASRVIAAVRDRFGGLDGLVNAHGVIGEFHRFVDIPEAEWRRVLDINLMGPVFMTTLAVPLLRANGGSVVNVSSINAIQAEPWVAPYGVSKAALAALTKYAAGELAGDGIRVNAVLPGWVMTPMGEPFLREAGLVGKPIESNMLGRAADPSEIATVVEFLLSPRASFITGELLVADGGAWMKLAPLQDRSESNWEET